MPNSIYTPYDSRFQNPMYNQQTGAYGYQGKSTSGGTGGASGLGNYGSNPGPTGGNGAYGLVPGTIGVPPTAWQQTTSAIPALGDTSQLTGNIMHELQGDINPQALKNMQDAAASYGISSGMPGSNAQGGTLAFNKNLRNIGLDTQAIQHQGAQDYNSLLGAVSGLQTPQSLAAEIAAHNAQLRAAPDPAAAAQQQQADYWRALNATRGPGGGTGAGGMGPAGGTGVYAPVNQALGFGFGSYGGQQQGQGSGSFGGTTSTLPGGSSSTWSGQDFGSLFGDPYAGAPTQNAYAPPGTIQGQGQSTYDPYAQFGQSYYDQNGSGFSPTDLANLSNEDYFYAMGSGA